VTFVTGHVLDDDTLDWRHLAGPNRTVVFYMGVGHLPQIVAKLRGAGAPGAHPVAIIERATLPEQRVVRGTLETIAGLAHSASVAPPALLIVGEVTAFASPDSLIETATSALLARTDGAIA